MSYSKISIRFFDDRKVRAIWDEDQERLYECDVTQRHKQ
jgi:hypothetical protein